ncbi:MAG: TauD/TfdA family dioxygenase [Bryobacteraceae bacterium]
MVSPAPQVLHSAPYQEPFSGAEAWRGSDFEEPGGGVYYLKPETVAEMEQNAERLRSDDRVLFSITRDDFPLPSFSADAAVLRNRLRAGTGFVIVKGLPIERYTEHEASLLYWGLGMHLGRPIPQNVKGDLLYSVRDEGYVIDRDYGVVAGVRTSKTTAKLNYHTDSPCLMAGNTPDIVCLLTLQTAKSGGESAIISGATVHNILLAERPDYLARLYQPFHMDRRAETPPGEPAIVDVPVLAYGGELRVRYLRLYITKGHEFTGDPLDAAGKNALDYLDGIMNRDGIPFTFGMDRGDMQFVNNVFIPHSRTEFQDYPEPERKRHYMRLWLAN